MSYKSEFASNNTDLQTILDMVNGLPDKGSGEAELELITVYMSSDSVASTLHHLNANGEYVTSTISYVVSATTIKGSLCLITPNSPNSARSFAVTAGTNLGSDYQHMVFTADAAGCRISYAAVAPT